LDLVALKYAVQVNGVTTNDDEGDVLSGFETLKVCTEYNYKGKNIAHFLITLSRKCNSTQEFKGWKQDLTGMTTYEELPSELKEYIEFIEKKLKYRSKLFL
jgi:adenylosuccinate synthase